MPCLISRPSALHADGFRHGEFAVLGELHVGDEGLDDLGGGGARGGAEPERGDQRREAPQTATSVS